MAMNIKDSIIEILGRLVSFPTISSASNLNLLKFIEDYSRVYGSKSQWFYNEHRNKANLLLTIGPETEGGIVLSGHTDVVPIDNQIWTDDPFKLRNADGKLIGRGAVDMKGFLACCLAALPVISKSSLKRPLHLAFSYDEEVGCIGVHSMAKWLGEHPMKPAFAIIGEPSKMKPVNAHKGGLIGWFNVKGKAGHSSQPDLYVNSIMVASKLVNFIDDMRNKLREGPLFERLNPAYSTLQVNRIKGGSAGNIVAENCSFFFEMRTIPNQDPESLLSKIQSFANAQILHMRKIDSSCNIKFEIVARVPALQPNINSAIEKQVLNILGNASLGAVSYSSEAGIFQENGIPAIICGPGDIAQAHQPEEFIDTAQLIECYDFIREVSNILLE